MSYKKKYLREQRQRMAAERRRKDDQHSYLQAIRELNQEKKNLEEEIRSLYAVIDAADEQEALSEWELH